MPLTNPNKVVTEKRLSEFYGQILPYMGGMPDVLANKFSKGDLYSTDEKMIGVWTDGKPLYQKTFNVTNDVDVTTDGTEAYFSVDIASANYIDTMVNLDSVIITSNSVIKPCYVTYQSDIYFIYRSYVNSTKTRVSFSNNRIAWNRASINLTIQYTKTTDSPISIGSETDYSTDEKIVGTWIDGRPVWQKTVPTGGNVPSGATLILRTAMASTGYDTILYTKTS